MNPADYDAWYDTPRGRWIGETEFALLRFLLDPRPDERLLDVGCGTGWFTRRFASLPGLDVTGVDPNTNWLAFARSHDARSTYLEADAARLPFADRSFDRVVSVTALCFVADWPRALTEIVRVTRRRFVVGLLNRRSVLHRQKGRDGGRGTYRGAHWHTAAELRRVLAGLPIAGRRFRYAVFLPSGSTLARLAEPAFPATLPLGGFLAIAGDIVS